MESRYKLDITFYTAFKKIVSDSALMVLFHALEALVLSIFLPIDLEIWHSPNNLITSSIIFALTVSLFCLIFWICYLYAITHNNQEIFQIARKYGHITQQPILASTLGPIEQCVSQEMFNMQNGTLVSMEGLTDQIKSTYISMCKSITSRQMDFKHPLLSSARKFQAFLCFSSWLFALVALIKTPTTVAQKVVMIVYLVFQFFNNFLAVIVIILIALSPLFCIGLLFYYCCCFVRAEETYPLPQEQKATSKLILDAGGQCSICFMQLELEQKVVVLKCNEKHIFHKICIEGWAKLKANCPICRAYYDGSPGNND